MQTQTREEVDDCNVVNLVVGEGVLVIASIEVVPKEVDVRDAVVSIRGVEKTVVGPVVSLGVVLVTVNGVVNATVGGSVLVSACIDVVPKEVVVVDTVEVNVVVLRIDG